MTNLLTLSAAGAEHDCVVDSLVWALKAGWSPSMQVVRGSWLETRRVHMRGGLHVQHRDASKWYERWTTVGPFATSNEADAFIAALMALEQ